MNPFSCFSRQKKKAKQKNKKVKGNSGKGILYIIRLDCLLVIWNIWYFLDASKDESESESESDEEGPLLKEREDDEAETCDNPSTDVQSASCAPAPPHSDDNSRDEEESQKKDDVTEQDAGSVS